MEFSRRTTNISSHKTLIVGLVFFLVIISLFSLIYINSAHAEYFDPESSSNSSNFKEISGGGGFFSSFLSVLLAPLLGIAKLLLTLSQILFTWVLDTGNITTIFGNDALYKSWTYVRDFLNMAFIMVLLWSAFCTIFQVEQYNYKKLLWKIVLMALLVNFSFPITRFIIDASNILMYSLINTEILTNATFAKGAMVDITKNSSFDKILNPGAASATFMIGSIAIIFMLAITFLAIGVLLLIRLIALAILLILSPIAFVGSILPGFSSYASKWWDSLFKYSFFGPIMIFGVIVTVNLMNAIGSSLSASAIAVARNSTENATFLGSIAFIMVPIVLLWMVLGIAQSMSIAGAGAVVGKAQGMIKAGLAAPGKLAWRGIKKGAESTGVPGGLKQKWNQFKKTGSLGSDARERREAEWAEKGPYSVKGAINEQARKKANEKLDEWKKIGPPPEKELKDLLGGSDNIKARAAALQLAESTGFNGNYDNYKKALEVMGGDQSAMNALNEKTNKKGRDLILAHKVNTEKDADGNPLKLQNELAKLSSSDFSGINFENLIKHTKESGDRGGKEAVQSFFTSIKDNPDRKTQISRNISPKNEAYLEENHIFARKEQGKQEPKEEPKIEVVGGSYSSRGKTTFDKKGKI